MKRQPRLPLIICAAVGAMFWVGALTAEAPLSQDAEGSVWFRTPDGTVLKVGATCEVTIDGRSLINCRERPGGEVELDVGKAEWRGGFLEVEDRFGNELEVYPTHAEAEASDGSEYQLALQGSPVGGHLALEISGDWRGVETGYRADDTEGILVELGAVQEDDYIRLALGGDILFDFDSTVVRPGGVEITAGGIRIPGVTLGGRAASDEAPNVCASGKTCALSCPHGDCNMTCEADADCDFSCTGGDCVMRCATGAECDFSCPGGDCHFECAAGSKCRTSCLGGDCSRS